jgi:glycosyltransferase involved in cell wall biosynthesis
MANGSARSSGRGRSRKPAATSKESQSRVQSAPARDPEQPPRVIGLMLVKNESQRYLRRVLNQYRELCDMTIVLDDCSTDDTVDVCKEYTPYVYESSESLWAVNEVHQRRRLWNMLREHDAEDGDWVLYLDADETIANTNLLVPLLSAADAVGDIDALSFNLYDMWDETHYRDDQYWSAHTTEWVFMVKYHRGRDYLWNERSLHCGRFPTNAVSGFYPTKIAVQHWGWAKPEDRKKKYERYMQADPEGTFGWLEQYHSILDPEPHLVPFDR